MKASAYMLVKISQSEATIKNEYPNYSSAFFLINLINCINVGFLQEILL